MTTIDEHLAENDAIDAGIGEIDAEIEDREPQLDDLETEIERVEGHLEPETEALIGVLFD